MLAKAKIYFLMFALLGGLSLGWLKAEKARARAQGRAEQALLVLDQRAAEHASIQRQLSDSIAQLKTTENELNTTRASLQSVLDSLRNSNQMRAAGDSALIARLRSQLPSSDVTLVIERISTLSTEARVCGEALTTCDLQRQNLGEQLLVADLRLRADSVLIANQLQTIAALEGVSSTGSSSTLPWAIAIIATALAVVGAIN
jgi:hypothetical protein